MNREKCLLDDKELIDSLLKLQKKLFLDFSKNKLQECEICAKNKEPEVRRKIHQKLIDVYNDLSDIKRALGEKQ